MDQTTRWLLLPDEPEEDEEPSSAPVEPAPSVGPETEAAATANVGPETQADVAAREEAEAPPAPPTARRLAGETSILSHFQALRIVYG